MKNIQSKIAGLTMAVLVLAGTALAQPVNDNFANATVISGLSGTTSGNNLGATMENGEPTPVIADDDGPGPVDVTNSVWFEWTAPQSGQVEFDTIGSVDDTFNPMDTVLTAYTGTSVTSLTLINADDNSGDGLDTSSNSFFAVAGTTYYIGVYLNADTPGNPGNYVLNWNEQGANNSGSLQFTANGYFFSQNEDNAPLDSRGRMGARPARATVTRSVGANGAVQVGYQLSETLYTNWAFTNEYILSISNSVTDTNYNYLGYTNVNVLVDDITTVYQNYNKGGFYTNYYKYANVYLGTNFNGAIPIPNFLVTNYFGIMPFNFASNGIAYVTNVTLPQPNHSFGVITNGPDIITTYTNWAEISTSFTNFLTSYTGVTVDMSNVVAYITNGTLNLSGGQVEFPDFEMNEDIDLPPGSTLANYQNDLLYVTITNANLDPVEDQNLLPVPQIGSVSNTLVTFLSQKNADRDLGLYDFGATNYLYGQPQADTNCVVNFERSTLVCDKTVGGTAIAYVYVTLSRGSPSGVTVNYRTDHLTKDDNYNTFTAQAGSDYARPNDPADNIYCATNDFTSQINSVVFPANDTTPQLIQIPISQDNQVKFDRDFLLQFSGVSGGVFGQITNCDVTIAYTTEPAGAVDTAYNTENNALTSPPNNSNPGANGEVFAVVVDPNSGESYIGGNFNGYNNDSSAYQNYIAKIGTDGELDTSFNSGSGFDGAVASLTLDASGNIIAGGQFHSLNGNLYNGIARLLPSGSADPSFNPGYGAQYGSVMATAIQPDGKILIGGSFTSYNQTNINGIARLNTDGSLDTSFNPGTGVAGTVNCIAVGTNGAIYIGGSFTNVEGNNVSDFASLNADGSYNSGFAVGSGMDAPVSAIAYTNGQILIAGSFTELNGQEVGPGVARLNSDASVDSTFNVGTGPDNSVYAMTLQPDGKILITGIFQNFNQTRRIGVARLLSNGWLDTSFMDVAYNQYAGVPNYYNNPAVNQPNPVDAVAVQPDGNVLIGGSFDSVGGDGGPYTIGNTTFFQIWTRNNMHPRNNFARLIGGVTPGPGNIGLSLTSYSANITSPTFFVTMARTNGYLGPAGVTFEALPLGTGPGYAAYGVDYTLNTSLLTWETSYSGVSWMKADGLTGPNNDESAINGTFYLDATPVIVNIISNNNANTTLDIGVTQPQLLGFTLGGENIPLGVALGNDLAPLTIVHNPISAGTFNLSQSYYSVNENAGTVSITVTRTGGSGDQATVNYSTADNTAFSGTDYTHKSGTLTFGNGVTSQSFSVAITPGTIARPDRIFNVSIFNPSGGATMGTVTNAPVEIINNNITSGFAELVNGVPISSTTMGYGTNENQGAVLLTVARLGGTTGSLSVNVATTNGTATNGVNYTGSTNTLTWIAGDSSLKTVVVPVIDDNVVTSNLTFTARLYGALYNGSATTNLYGPYTNAVVTITNTDSAGTAEFTASAYTVNENAGFALIPVIRTGGSSGTLSVMYSNVDGTATAAANYGAVHGTLVFAPGQISTNFTVAITNLNSQWISPLNFSLVLSNAIPTNGLGTPNVAQINIDGSQAFNQPPGNPDGGFSGSFNGAVQALALQADGKLVAGGAFTQVDGVARQRIARLEANGTLDTTFSSYLPTAGASASIRALLYQTNGLIVVGGFFTNYNNTTLNHIARVNVNGSLDSSFVPGAGTDNPIYALAQNYVNGQRRIVVGGAFTIFNGVSRNCIAQLLDNGNLDTSFAPVSGANATVYAVATQPNGQILIGGDFTQVNGTNCGHIARLNLDGSVDTSFNPGTGAGDSVRALAVQLDGRILVGGVFTNFNGNTNASHLVRLNANGSLDTSFVMTNGEANANVNALSVQSDTRIVVGGDFTQYNGVTRNHVTRLNPDGTTDLTINFGLGTDGSVLASTIETDGEIDLGGSFANYNGSPHANIVRVYGGSLAGSGTLQFTSSGYSVNENGVVAYVSVLRTGGTSGPNANGLGNINVNLATSDGTAVANTDDRSITNYDTIITNLTFPPGEVLQTVAIPVFDDGIITNTLTVNLTLSGQTPPASLVPYSTLYILNDDSAINFALPLYTVAKNVPGGTAEVDLYRIGGTNSISTVVFNTTTNGSATPGTDYGPLTNVLVTFNAGVTDMPVFITISNNSIFEGNQTTVGLSLSNAVGSALYSPSNAVLDIVNTLLLPGTLEFSPTVYNVHTGDTNAYLTVYRTNGYSDNVTVSYTTVNGTAVGGIDFQPTSGSLTFIDGNTNQTITVPLIQQSQVKAPVAFNVLLSNPGNGVTLSSATNAMVTIASSIAGISFNSATNSATENGSVAVIGLQRQFNTNSTVTVTYATSDGTATNGVNYTGTSGIITFTNGATQAAITVGLINNSNQINDLTFNLGLSNPTGGAQLLAPTNTVVVEQAANAGLSFTTNYNTVLKSAGAVTVTVACSNPRVESLNTNGYIAVNYYTVNGTAVAGSDYTATSGTLIFSNGIATNTFTVPINNNSLVTGDKQFSVVLANATPPGEVAPPSTQTVDIAESNAGLEFSQSAYNVFKNGAYATITVNRTGYTNSTVTVNYIATNGTAINGANFYATNGTLTFSNGVTSQSFQVAIIDNTQVDPNLNVLLQLLNPLPVPGAVLVPPSAAVLNILENSGSYVIPAGAQMVADPTSLYDFTNGIIGSNDTVQILFAFRDSAGLNVTNLNAVLLVTNGVTSPVPATAVNYSNLTVYGHSVSRLFQFTARGTNALPLTPTFNLYDNAKFIGTAAFSFTVGSWTASFANTNMIAIRDNTNASPYPSAISVSGIGGSLIKATVTLNKFTHSYPKDVDVLVTAPAGTNTLIMAHNGSSFSVTNLILTIDDAATNNLPSASILTNGVYKPTTNFLGRQFP